MCSPFKWLTWSPAQFPGGTKQPTKPPEPTKPSYEEGFVSFVSSPLRESQEIGDPQPDLPWRGPGYHGGKQFVCKRCGCRFDTSAGHARHQVYDCNERSGKHDSGRL
jgi:hypothetical protein